MDPYIKNDQTSFILSSTGASAILTSEQIQELWSGYGSIKRYFLVGSTVKSVVVKNVVAPTKMEHPRGWSGEISHQRKLKSYLVEQEWYRNWHSKLTPPSFVPGCYGVAGGSSGEDMTLVLEDLRESGFPRIESPISLPEVKTCLTWLANFHATFMGCEPNGLWPIGTYWHLKTRSEELKAIEDSELRNAASLIDEKLNTCRFKTFVHGDAKLANFCFSDDGKRVAAVDFQYVGGGCGMKDVAYFLGSCLSEAECNDLAEDLLDYYFSKLGEQLDGREFDFTAIQAEWRALYPLAWADFYRFLQGWSPGHWKMNSYSERLTREVLRLL